MSRAVLEALRWFSVFRRAVDRSSSDRLRALIRAEINRLKRLEASDAEQV